MSKIRIIKPDGAGQESKVDRYSFGDVVTQLNLCFDRYGLTCNEFRILMAMANAFSRPDYKADLSEILTHRMEYWAKKTCMLIPHVSRAISGLVKKGLLHKMPGTGKRISHCFTANFIKTIVRGIMGIVENDAVDNVDNFGNDYQTGNKDITEPVTSSYQAGNKDITEPVTSSYQPGKTPSYIEGSLPSSPDFNSLPSPRSSSPVIPSGDKTEPQCDDAVRLSQFITGGSVKDAAAYIAKLRRASPDAFRSEVMQGFMDVLKARGLSNLTLKDLDKVLALYIDQHQKKAV